MDHRALFSRMLQLESLHLSLNISCLVFRERIGDPSTGLFIPVAGYRATVPCTSDVQLLSCPAKAMNNKSREDENLPTY
jgi:hypothetical protein